MNILFTGANGFIGKNIIQRMHKDYQTFTPTRDELDLFDVQACRKYIIRNKIDIIIHSANPNPVRNNSDTQNKMLHDSLSIFLSLYYSRDLYKKMIYFGSGAEYNKKFDINFIQETHKEIQNNNYLLPNDDYGLGKSVMNELALCSANVYNMCLFGCYGPGDADSKFITHCINCCRMKQPITIRQDCLFDYIHVYDLVKPIYWIIENTPKYHSYNICSGEKKLLSEIANEVKKQMNSKEKIIILKEGFNNEYTADNSRFTIESGISPEITLENGISIQIKSELERYK